MTCEGISGLGRRPPADRTKGVGVVSGLGRWRVLRRGLPRGGCCGGLHSGEEKRLRKLWGQLERAGSWEEGTFPGAKGQLKRAEPQE